MYIVYYTGIGANADGIHTIERFIEVAMDVGFYKDGSTRNESMFLSASESGAIVYQIVQTEDGLKLQQVSE